MGIIQDEVIWDYQKYKCGDCKFYTKEIEDGNPDVRHCSCPNETYNDKEVLSDQYICSQFIKNLSKEEESSSRHQENDKEDHIPDAGKMVSEFLNYLLQRFNDYEVPITMSAEQVRNYLIEFEKEYEGNKEIPMGVSQWKEMGIKYGYDKYFNIKWEEEKREEETNCAEEVYNKWKY